MKRTIRIGVGGPVGSGKTLLIERLTRHMADKYSIGVITNDIYTKEDAEFCTSGGSYHRCRDRRLPSYCYSRGCLNEFGGYR